MGSQLLYLRKKLYLFSDLKTVDLERQTGKVNFLDFRKQSSENQLYQQSRFGVRLNPQQLLPDSQASSS